MRGVDMTEKAEDIITDEEIERVHGSTQIIAEHGLIDDEYRLTPKGRMYLWAAFSSAISV
jgi:hypothetical protein